MSKNRQRMESAFSAGYQLGRYNRNVGEPKARWLHGAWRAGIRLGAEDRAVVVEQKRRFFFGTIGKLKSNFKAP